MVEKSLIGIASPSEMEDRLKTAARSIKEGANDRNAIEPKVWMCLDTAFKLFGKENRRLLDIISLEKPESVSALAELAKLDQGNVSRMISRLETAGIVRLVKEGREKRPEICVESVTIKLDFSAGKYEVVADDGVSAE